MKAEKQLTRKESDTLTDLINLAIQKYGAQNVAALFLESYNDWRNLRAFKDAVSEHADMKQELKEYFIDEARGEGFAVVKLESIEKQSLFNEFMQRLFPYYNEQTNLQLF